MKRYIVYKKDIENYRVVDTVLNKIVYMGANLTLVGCDFKVNSLQYAKAKNKNFVNSGNENDFFAWIACDKFAINDNKIVYPNKVYYNPFKAELFKDRQTENNVFTAKIVTTIGNLLTYHKG